MTLLKVQLRRDPAAAWTANNPLLLAGEVGWESDTGLFKIGDGATLWVDLPYSPPTDRPGAYVGVGTDSLGRTVIGTSSVTAPSLRQFISVMDAPFSAAGNGTDDTTPVQNAINAASTLAGGAGQVSLLFPAGFTFLLGQITPKSNVRIVATGATLKLKPTAIQAMFFYNSATPLVRFTIDGGTYPGTGSETTVQAVMQINNPGNASDVEVFNTYVTNWATGPFYFGNVVRAKAINNTMLNCCTATGTNAINFVSQIAAGSVQSCIATNNTITGCKTQAIAYVNTGTTSNLDCRVVIANNIVECVTSNLGGGIDIECSTTGIGENAKFVVANNSVTYDGPSTTGYAVSINSGSSSLTDALTVNRVTCTGNTVDSTANGIQFGCSYGTCSGNVITSAQAAIYAGRVANNPALGQVITGNTCHAGTGITNNAVINAQFIQHSKISGNYITADASPTSPNASGIQVANAGWVDVLDNTVESAPRHGIVVGGNDMEVRGNRVYNPNASNTASVHGILFNTVTGQYARAIDNTVIDDRGTHQMVYGVALTSTPIAEIRGNRISGWTAAPIFGTPAVQTDNALSTGSRQGRATLVAGSVGVNTAEIQAGDNVILSVVVPGGTRGQIQLGTITAGTSFVVNSVQPGTASTLQSADTSTIYWKIDH